MFSLLRGIIARSSFWRPGRIPKAICGCVCSGPLLVPTVTRSYVFFLLYIVAPGRSAMLRGFLLAVADSPLPENLIPWPHNWYGLDNSRSQGWQAGPHSCCGPDYSQGKGWRAFAVVPALGGGGRSKAFMVILSCEMLLRPAWGYIRPHITKTIKRGW